MRSAIVMVLSILLSSCSSLPKCGNPEGAKVIFSGKDTCLVRIRQVTIGSDLKIPKSLKGSGLAQFTLDWVDPSMVDGRIDLGHFELVPNSSHQEIK